MLGDFERDEVRIAKTLQPLKEIGLFVRVFHREAVQNLCELSAAVGTAHGPNLAEGMASHALQVLQILKRARLAQFGTICLRWRVAAGAGRDTSANQTPHTRRGPRYACRSRIVAGREQSP